MSTIKYNRSLDMVLLAMKSLREGKEVQAAKLFASAVKGKDAVTAMHILEANLRYAHNRMVANEHEYEHEFEEDEDFDIDDVGHIDADADDLGDILEFEDGEDDDFEEDEVELVEARRRVAARKRTTASNTARAFSRALARGRR